MTTARSLINRAHRLIGTVKSGDAVNEAYFQDGLTALNTMIGSWQTEKLNVYAFVDTAFTIVATDASYTVGPAGNFALTPRPSKIENVYVRANNIDYPVELIDKDKWLSIPDKTSDSDIPMYAYYDPTLPTGTLQLWPVPNTAHSLHIVTWTTLAELASLSTTITLPQGYERALAYNLAVEIAPEYETEASPSVQSIASESKTAIKRMNNRPMLMSSELSYLIGGQRSNIYSGGAVA